MKQYLVLQNGTDVHATCDISCKLHWQSFFVPLVKAEAMRTITNIWASKETGKREIDLNFISTSWILNKVDCSVGKKDKLYSN